MDDRFQLLVGDAQARLADLPDGSVNCIATSPPYYGLRDYGVDGQIGLEESPDAYVARLVDVFRAARRVLHPDGTLWLNLGDTYAANRSYQVHETIAAKALTYGKGAKVPTGMKQKDMMGIPWMVAFALRADGWYLRSEVVWAKPDPMPESVEDRLIRAHEKVFMLSRSHRYFFDWYSMRERAVDGGMKNGRDVWAINAENIPEAHHAVYPRELARRMIQAGTSDEGRCETCKAPYDRIVLREKAWRDVAAERAESAAKTGRTDGHIAGPKGVVDQVRHGGWKPRCDHHAPLEPCVVLDPFLGSGQTAIQALRMGRSAVGIELNPDYAALAAQRIQPVLDQQALF